MKSRFTYLILAISLLMTVSCSKDEDSAAPDPVPFLTTNSWEVDEIIPLGSLEEQIALAFLTAFEDTAYTFTQDGNFVSNDALFGLDNEGTWTVSDDNKTLFLTQYDELVKMEILSISSSEMKWRRVYTKEELDYTKDLTVDMVLKPFTKTD